MRKTPTPAQTNARRKGKDVDLESPQSTFPPPLTPVPKMPPKASFSLPNHTLPPRLRALRPMMTPTAHMPSSPIDDNQGCLDQLLRMSQKTWPSFDVDDLGASLGGLEMVFGSVSRMDVREGTIGFPVEVWSQYCLFCGEERGQ